MTSPTDVYYDPYDVDIFTDPYPALRRLREEAPLYYNEKYDFYALSRFHDVERGYGDHETFSSQHGSNVETIQSGLPVPKGVFISEDPPMHTVHRGLLARVFTPKTMNALEPQVREYCRQALDPLVGGDHFDFVADLGLKMPMSVLGMLLGIPEEDREAVRVHADERVSREPGKQPKARPQHFLEPGFIGDYLDWRIDHPSDDLMTRLLHVEFEDETGTTRRLTRDEVLTFVNVLVPAGNETTMRLIGWAGKVLGDHPDQRRDLVNDPSLIPNAIEELLRFEPPAVNGARYVTRDVEYYGQTVPAGSTMMLIRAAANRDHRAFPPDGDAFDIHRKASRHMAFGYGVHFCLGAALARLEGRVALEEVLDRFPEWDVDLEHAELGAVLTRPWVGDAADVRRVIDPRPDQPWSIAGTTSGEGEP